MIHDDLNFCVLRYSSSYLHDLQLAPPTSTTQQGVGAQVEESVVMLREKVDKKVRLRWDATRRSHVSVVREHYFRDDISCKSELCSIKECQNNSKECECDKLMSD